MSLQDKIDALPPWSDELSLGGSEEDRNYVDIHAALARLALARDLARIGDKRLILHRNDCALFITYPEGGIPRIPCTCGRDALLAALGEPNECR